MQTVAHEIGHNIFLGDEYARGEYDPPTSGCTPGVGPPVWTVMISRYFIQSNGMDQNTCAWQYIPHDYTTFEAQHFRLR